MKATVVNPELAQLLLIVADVPSPRPRPDWVVVRLDAAALNRLDAMLLDDRSAEAPGTIFGSDGAGVIVELGEEVTPRGGICQGSEVIISPSLFWGDGDAVPGPSYEILGSPTHGTHAEYVAVAAANVYGRPSLCAFTSG